MRLCSILVAAAVAAALASPGARACGLVPAGCGPTVLAVPVYTREGLRAGTFEAVARAPLGLEISPFTGQPIAVVYNDPGRLPGSIAPGLALVPLPHAPRFHTRAAYPRGY